MKHSFAKTLGKHKTKIAFAVSIGATVGAVVTAVRGTVKAVRLCDKKKEELHKDKLTPKEIIKTTWKCYIPTAGLMVGAIASSAIGSSIDWSNVKHLAATNDFNVKELRDYKKAVVESIGEEKAKEVEKKKIENKVAELPVTNIINAGYTGTYLICDSISGQLVRANWEEIEKKVNDLNRQMRDELEITVNEYLTYLGFKAIDRSLGEMVWDIDDGYIDIYPESCVTNSGEPAIVIAHSNGPRSKLRRT